jgi:hypothetical protein
MQIHFDDVIFNEADFVRFNPEGFRSVKDSIESARVKRALALTGEEMREASLTLQAALERKNTERRVARERFEREKQQAHGGLQGVISLVDKGGRDWSDSARVSRDINELIERYTAKDFTGVTAGVASIRRRLEALRPARRTVVHATSASASFYSGARLEAQGDIAGALLAYEQCLSINPRHVQAVARIERLRGPQAQSLGRY